MTSVSSLQQLRFIPKIELHAHLNGCARISHLVDLVDPSELPALPADDASPTQYFDFMAAVSRITASPGNLRIVVNRVLEDFQADGVVYLELRSSPKHTMEISKVQYIETIISCMEEFEGAMIVRYLVSVDQSKPLSDMLENAQFAIKYTRSSPFVVGVDLCGNFLSTNKANTLQVLKLCKDAGLKIACHIAEDKAINDQTLDLLHLIEPTRLGHATFILPDSEEGKFLRSKEMLIECCMTSNLKCKSVICLKLHHFKRWYDLKHPVLLCTDDPGTFDTTLSIEYSKAMESFGLSIKDLIIMNVHAINWIFDDTVKDELKSVFDLQVMNFD